MVSTPLKGKEAAATLMAKVAWLKQAGNYPGRPGQVEAIETHMSWVFLTDHDVYKLKKPVRYDFLDFSTLAARQQDCEEEVRLNQRLAAGVYLGTVPLTQDGHGRFALGGTGEVVEWLVHMRRLPRDRMLDYLIRQDTLVPESIRPLAQLLAGFYRRCPTVAVDGGHHRQRLERGIRQSREALADPIYELGDKRVRAVHDAQLDYLQREAALFARRFAEGRIVEGHGDLRPEHVCLLTPPVVFDCLEFNRQFRIVDAADELASLAMECELLGTTWIGGVLFHTYEDLTGDRPPAGLLSFYKASRACLRARLAIWHTRELKKSGWPKWRRRAAEYLALAEGYSHGLHA